MPKHFKALIIAAGTESPATLKAFTKANNTIPFPLIICADGGANYACKARLTPDVVIGDFDSITEETKKWIDTTKAKVIKYPVEKDASDLELAIEHATSLGSTDITLTCALGDRADHYISNLMILAQQKFKDISFTIIEDTIRIYTLSIQELTFTGSPEDTFSIIPITEIVSGLTVTGAYWNLTNVTIYRGSTRTLSNRFQQSSITVKIESGTAFLFHVTKESAPTS